MSKIAIARHCRTPWNDQGRIQGQTDIALGPQGELDSARLGRNIRSELGTQITHIVTSDLKRAIETALIVAQALCLSRERVIIDPGLREARYGELEGLTPAEVARAHGEYVFYPPVDFRPFGGESGPEIYVRQVTAIAIAQRRCLDPSALLIIGHSCALNVMLYNMTGEPFHLKTGEFRLVDLD